MEPRIYAFSDRAGCLEVFDSNGLDGREGFEEFLDSRPAGFIVLEHEGAIVGCGGYSIRTDGTATLLHGMIRKDMQRMGLGRFLLLYRLRLITNSTLGVRLVSLTTNPQAAGFYQGQGFKPAGGQTGPAIELVMKLTVCA